jgi:hypothetical protein
MSLRPAATMIRRLIGKTSQATMAARRRRDRSMRRRCAFSTPSMSQIQLELYFSLLLLPSLLPPIVFPRRARCCQCAVLLPRCAHLTFCGWLAARCCKDDPSLDRKADKPGNDGGMPDRRRLVKRSIVAEEKRCAFSTPLMSPLQSVSLRLVSPPLQLGRHIA